MRCPNPERVSTSQPRLPPTSPGPDGLTQVAEPGTLYYVTIDKGAFLDEADNEFEGFLARSAFRAETSMLVHGCVALACVVSAR